MEILIVAGATLLAGLAALGFATFAECKCPNALAASVVATGTAAASLIIFEFWPIIVGLVFAFIAYLPFLISKARSSFSGNRQQATSTS